MDNGPNYQEKKIRPKKSGTFSTEYSIDLPIVLITSKISITPRMTKGIKYFILKLLIKLTQSLNSRSEILPKIIDYLSVIFFKIFGISIISYLCLCLVSGFFLFGLIFWRPFNRFRKNYILPLIKLPYFVLNLDNVLRFRKILFSDRIYPLTCSNKTLYREFLCPILAKNLSSNDRLLILIHNYIFINEHFLSTCIDIMFDGRVTLWNSKDSTNSSTIALAMSSTYTLIDVRLQSIEGIFQLIYLYNDEPIFIFGFTIAPGNLFGVSEKNIILISRMQAEKNKSILYKSAVRKNATTTPGKNLFHALIGIAKKFKINTIVSVSAENVISNKKGMLSIHSTYNDFMETFEDIERINDYYVLRLPYSEKPTKSSDNKKIKRGIKRREFNREISLSVCMYLDELVSL